MGVFAYAILSSAFFDPGEEHILLKLTLFTCALCAMCACFTLFGELPFAWALHCCGLLSPTASAQLAVLNSWCCLLGCAV